MALTGKVILITGAASGIGRAQVQQFAEAGARIVAVDLDRAGLDGLEAEAAAAGHTVFCRKANVADAAEIGVAVSEAESKFGQIDILINTAGVLDGYTKSLDTSQELWDRVLGVNLTGVFRLTNLALPGMIARGNGVIINVASVAGLMAGAGGAAYTASKHAIIGYTRQLAHDYGRHGIRANAICPGMIETAMTRDVLGEPDSKLSKAVRKVPAGRVGTPLDIAKLSVFLAGDGADFIHGAAVVIDGGLTIK